MSVQRCANLATTSSTLNFAAYVLFKPARSCPHATRQFTSSLGARMSSKRKLVTTTAYRPSSLDPIPSPPRNAGIPETSITEVVPQFNDIRPPKHAQSSGQPSTTVEDPRAQESKSSISTSHTRTTTDETASAAPAKPRRKLRPRKAAISLTPSAIGHLRALLAQPEPKLIRVGVKNKGCSGLAYHLEYVDKPGQFDEEVDQEDVKVLIDSKALLTIIGSEMDWVEDKLSQRFVFRNPNIKEQCGCGESFMV